MANRGNLIQHWTFCQIVATLRTIYPEKALLQYVDAYAMAPGSDPDPSTMDKAFQRCMGRLPGENTHYEQAWQLLHGKNGGRYPSSAAFVRHLWGEAVTFCLCDNNRIVRAELDRWLESQSPGREYHPPRAHGDWRQVPRLPCTLLGDLCLMQFDPNVINVGDAPRYPTSTTLYASEIAALADQIGESKEHVVLQLNSYPGQNVPNLGDVATSIGKTLLKSGFDPVSAIPDSDLKTTAFALVFAIGIDKQVLRDLSNATRTAEFEFWYSRATASPE